MFNEEEIESRMEVVVEPSERGVCARSRRAEGCTPFRRPGPVTALNPAVPTCPGVAAAGQTLDRNGLTLRTNLRSEALTVSTGSETVQSLFMGQREAGMETEGPPQEDSSLDEGCQLSNHSLADCEECKSHCVEECEIHGPPSFIPDSPAPLGVPQRALLTLPPGMMVSRSSIPEAGLGVFNQGETVPVGTHFGPYEGEVTNREEAMESSYSWVICRKKHQFEFIDAKRDTHSNWLRYVNCARSEEEQNLVAFQHRGRIFYRCLRPILPGQELLLWHEDDYAKELGITWDHLWDKKCTPAGRFTKVFPCLFCQFSFSGKFFLNKHIKRSHLKENVKMLESNTIEVMSLPSSSEEKLLALPVSPSPYHVPSTTIDCGAPEGAPDNMAAIFCVTAHL
ncbi:histone-lysine N-methyltransferase PRDM9-like [Arapaima gigas]